MIENTKHLLRKQKFLLLKLIEIQINKSMSFMNIFLYKTQLYFENADSNTQKIQLKISDLKNDLHKYIQ